MQGAAGSMESRSAEADMLSGISQERNERSRGHWFAEWAARKTYVDCPKIPEEKRQHSLLRALTRTQVGCTVHVLPASDLLAPEEANRNQGEATPEPCRHGHDTLRSHPRDECKRVLQGGAVLRECKPSSCYASHSVTRFACALIMPQGQA